MTSFFEEYRRDLKRPAFLVVWALLTFLFGLSGPFGSYAAVALPMRLLVWAGIVALGIVLGTLVRAAVVVNYNIASTVLRVVLIGAISAVIWTPLAYFSLHALFAAALPEFPSYLEMAFFIFATCVTTGLFRNSISTVMGQSIADVQPPDPTFVAQASVPAVSSVRLLQRLPAEMMGTLEAISVRDHYVDVRTSVGQASVLMRLSDAIAETEGVDGTQVHRSHWVAWQAISHAERSGTNLILVLRDGHKIPVSRNHREKVEARGVV